MNDTYKEVKNNLTTEEERFPVIGKNRYIEGIGRRKESTVRVRIYDKVDNEKNTILINDRDYGDYFKNIEFQKIVKSPLEKIKGFSHYQVIAKVKGGGLRGQAEAIRLGLSRALVKLNSEWKQILKKEGFLTRDARKVERKKYGKRKARKEEQWQKR